MWNIYSEPLSLVLSRAGGKRRVRASQRALTRRLSDPVSHLGHLFGASGPLNTAATPSIWLLLPDWLFIFHYRRKTIKSPKKYPRRGKMYGLMHCDFWQCNTPNLFLAVLFGLLAFYIYILFFLLTFSLRPFNGYVSFLSITLFITLFLYLYTLLVKYLIYIYAVSLSHRFIRDESD